MLEIRNFAEATAALLPYVPLVATLTGKDTTLDRIRPLMALLGDPQDKIKIIHIAGTSGKTSTAYFTAALLGTADKHVGLTVSPHVDSITERVQLDGQPLSEARFCHDLAEFLEIVERAPEKPSYFELLYAFSFWVFERSNVEYAVVETGMGGLFDATNIADRADKFCIITDIGYDHMHILGHTLDKIAAQKAGIIQPGNTALMYEQAPLVMGAVHDRVERQDAELVLTTPEAEAAEYGQALVPSMPQFQQRNWLLAYKAYRLLAARDNLSALTLEQLQTTQRLQVPARMDIRQIGDKTIVMDGAHNAQKMQTFLESFKHEYPGVKPVILIGLKEGKEPQELGPLFAPLAARLIITTFDTSQDLPAKSTNPQVLAQLFAQAGVPNIQILSDHHAAYEALLAAPEKVCIMTGSFYLLSQMRELEHLA